MIHLCVDFLFKYLYGETYYLLFRLFYTISSYSKLKSQPDELQLIFIHFEVSLNFNNLFLNRFYHVLMSNMFDMFSMSTTFLIFGIFSISVMFLIFSMFLMFFMISMIVM